MRGIEHIPWLYDLSMSLMERTRLRRWREWLVRDASGRVLEIGCGTGRNLPLYATLPIASDPDIRLVLSARRRAPGARFVVAVAEALPFLHASVDTAVSSLALCSVADPERSLDEIARVLRDGGSLRSIEHVRANSKFLARLQDLGQPFWTWFTGGCHPNRDTERSVVRAGFDLVDRRGDGVMRRFAARRQRGR